MESSSTTVDALRPRCGGGDGGVACCLIPRRRSRLERVVEVEGLRERSGRDVAGLRREPPREGGRMVRAGEGAEMVVPKDMR